MCMLIYPKYGIWSFFRLCMTIISSGDISEIHKNVKLPSMKFEGLPTTAITMVYVIAISILLMVFELKTAATYNNLNRR